MMASLMLKTRPLTKCVVPKWNLPSISTTANLQSDDAFKAAQQKEAPQIKNDVALLRPEEAAHRNQLQNTIQIEGPTNLAPISGVPDDFFKTRRVRIYEPPKNAMQSGTNNIGHWELDFDTKERWENPLMGWCSTGDPLSNMKVQFSTKEDAIEYCERNGWEYYVQKSSLDKPFKPKSYGINFAWNKRTRVSTK